MFVQVVAGRGRSSDCKEAFTLFGHKGTMSIATLQASRPALYGRAALPAAGLALFVALSLCPVLLVEIPAMVDYPNHLARMSLLMRAGTADANPFYEIAWALYPNLAMDLLVPPLGRLLGLEAATRLFLLSSQILLVSGAVAIELVRRRRFLASGVTATMLLYSLPFAFGFVNFEFALGIALWGIALWIALRERPLAARAVHTAFVAVLFVSHLFALGIYGLTIGIIELRRVRTDRTPLPRAAAMFAILAAPALLGAVLLLAGGGSVGGSQNVWAPGQKLAWLFPLNGYWFWFSGACAAPLAFFAYVFAREGWISIESEGKWLGIGFLAVYLAMPFRLFDTAFVDLRVVVAAALILPSYVSLRVPARPWAITGAATVGAIAMANLGVVAYVQGSYQSEYRAIVSSFERLERGSRVLVGHTGDGDDPPADLMEYPIYHAPVLAVHYANALVPTLFAYPGKQPIVTRASTRAPSVRDSGPVPIAVLRDIAAGLAEADQTSFARNWTADFAYLYLVGKRIPNPMSERLEELATGARFTLYRIRTAQP